MISKRIERIGEIYEICKNSGDILPGAEFIGVVIAQDGDDVCFRIPDHSRVICCGRVNRNELLFRTADGRYYFSVCKGWGEKNGKLYGIEVNIYYDFAHATDAANIEEECKKQLGTYHTWGGAMAYHHRRYILDKILNAERTGM